MHKFMRTIGFGGCDSDLEMDKIMRKLAKTASKTAVLERNDHPTLYDLRAELNGNCHDRADDRKRDF